NFAMVLMGIVTPVRQNNIGGDACFEPFEPVLDLPAMHGEEAVPERQHFYLRNGRSLQEIISRRSRFILTLALGAQHAPGDITPNLLWNPGQKFSARPDLDVIRVRA